MNRRHSAGMHSLNISHEEFDFSETPSTKSILNANKSGRRRVSSFSGVPGSTAEGTSRSATAANNHHMDMDATSTTIRPSSLLYDLPSSTSSDMNMSVLFGSTDGPLSRRSMLGPGLVYPGSNKNSIIQTPGVLSRKWSESASALFLHNTGATSDNRSSVIAAGNANATAAGTSTDYDEVTNNTVNNNNIVIQRTRTRSETKPNNMAGNKQLAAEYSDIQLNDNSPEVSLEMLKDSCEHENKDHDDDAGQSLSPDTDVDIAPYASFSEKSSDDQASDDNAGTSCNSMQDTLKKDFIKRYKLWTTCVISVMSVLLLLSLGANAYLGFLQFNKPHKSTGLQLPAKVNTNAISSPPITMKDPEVAALLNNPKLKKVFYGFDYTPKDSQFPKCGVSQRDVTLDVAVLSQLTDKLRLYSTDCNQVDYVLTAIQDLGLNMTVSLGVWVGASLEVSLRQMSNMREILVNYPHRFIDSVLIGNEALYRNELTVSELVAYIDYARDYLHRQGMYDIMIGTSDVGVKWTSELAEHVDILAANIHPFYGGIDVRDSTKWTYDFLMNQISLEVPLERNISYMISEVGWPSGGGTIQGAVAGIDELQLFLDSWICTNQDPQVGWYWFEAFDEPWKGVYETDDQKWDTQWGLFSEDRQLKAIEIPSCEPEPGPEGASH